MKAIKILELTKQLNDDVDFIETIDEAIKELEELNNKSCDNCRYWNKKGFCTLLEIYNNIGGCGDYYEPKQ